MQKAFFLLVLLFFGTLTAHSKINSPLNHMLGKKSCQNAIKQLTDPVTEQLLHHVQAGYFDGQEDEFLKKLEILLVQGANPNAINEKGIPLFALVLHNATALKIFIEYGAQIKNDNGDRALHHAVFNNYIDSAKFLLEQGANPNHIDSIGNTPLVDAIRQSNYPMVRVLLQHGADPNKPSGDETGFPLYWALTSAIPDIVEILLQYGVDPNLNQNWKEATPLMCAVEDASMCALSLSHMKPEEIQAIHIKLLHDRLQIIQILLRYGADHTLKDKFGFAALDERYIRGNKEIIRLIMEHSKNS